MTDSVALLALHSPPMEFGHRFVELLNREIHRPRPRIEPHIETKIDRIGPVLDSGSDALDRPRWGEEFGTNAGRMGHEQVPEGSRTPALYPFPPPPRSDLRWEDWRLDAFASWCSPSS